MGLVNRFSYGGIYSFFRGLECYDCRKSYRKIFIPISNEFGKKMFEERSP